MKFGVLSIAFGEIGYRELARKIGSYGFDATHMELKHILDIDHAPGKLSTGCANMLAEEFQRHGVRIQALGMYTNLVDVNEERRQYGINQLKEHLRYARDFGASVVTTETGTVNPHSPWEHHPDNRKEESWIKLRAAVEELAEEAEKWGVFLGLEGYYNNVIDTLAAMERMLREVPSSNIGIVMDPCNYITQKDEPRQDEVIQEAFDKLSDRILIAHAKDFNYRHDDDTAEHKMVQPAAGTGYLNYPLYLKLLHERKPYVKIYLEHLAEHQMLTSMSFVRQIAESVRG